MPDFYLDGEGLKAGSVSGLKLADNAAIPRAKLAQVPNAVRAITPFEWRIWDSGAPLGTPANDDLGLEPGTFGTDVFVVNAGDVKAAGAVTRKALVQIALPDYYEAGQTVTLRLRAGVDTTIADDTCTLDVDAYEVGESGDASGPTNLYGGAAQDINNTTPANYDFTITPDNLSPGDVIEILITIASNDTATATAVIPTIYKASLLFDARG